MISRWLAVGDTISLRQLLASHAPGLYPDKNLYLDEKFEKIHTPAELRVQLLELQKYWAEQAEFASQLSFEGTLTRLHGPWAAPVVNPWLGFVGNYEITSRSCADGKPDSRSDLSGFLVYVQGSGLPELRQIWPSAWGDLGGLYDGASDINGGSAVTVDGATDWAERVAELGDRWGTIHRIDRFKISRSEAGLQMVESFEAWNLGKESHSECTYQLKKLP